MKRTSTLQAENSVARSKLLKNWNVEIVERLLEAGADVNVGSGVCTALHSVIVGADYNERVEMGERVAQMLIDAGMEVNLLDSEGRSPLFMALRIANGWQGMVDLLTAAGALEIGKEFDYEPNPWYVDEFGFELF